MTPQGHMTSQTLIGHYLGNCKRWSKTEQISKPTGFTTYEMTTFENINFGVTLPQKRKLAIILETLRDGAKRSKFPNPYVFYLRNTTFENIDLGVT